MSELQLKLLDVPPLKVKLSREMRFLEFDRKYPWVYTSLHEMAVQLKGAGFKRYSMRTMWEVLRWQQDRKVAGGKWELNDHLAPFYARKLMRENPRLRDFFETRQRGKSSSRTANG